MDETEKETAVRSCEHCGNRAPMKIVASYCRDDSEVDEWEAVVYFRAESKFQTLLCPSCNNVVLRRLDWDDSMNHPDDVSESVLYPESVKEPSGLPEDIQKAFEAAQRVRSLDANAYGVLVGRLLELVCEDQGAEGKNLFNKLNNLASKGIIPDRLSGITQGLRKLRNIAAHADLGELTKSQVPLLEKLARAILEYVYTAPMLADQAAQQLASLESDEAE